MLKLFTAHNSICTQKVFLTLIEKALPWTSEYIDLFNNEQYRPEYLKLNPKGVVPTLIHEGHAIVEFDTDLRVPRPDIPAALPGSCFRFRTRADAALEQAHRRRGFRGDPRDKLFRDVSR